MSHLLFLVVEVHSTFSNFVQLLTAKIDRFKAEIHFVLKPPVHWWFQFNVIDVVLSINVLFGFFVSPNIVAYFFLFSMFYVVGNSFFLLPSIFFFLQSFVFFVAPFKINLIMQFKNLIFDTFYNRCFSKHFLSLNFRPNFQIASFSSLVLSVCYFLTSIMSYFLSNVILFVYNSIFYIFWITFLARIFKLATCFIFTVQQIFGYDRTLDEDKSFEIL